MFIDHITDWLDEPRSLLTVAATPIIVVADLPGRSVRGLDETFSSRDDLRRRIAELEREQLLLKVRTEKMAALTAENNRLRDLLGSAAKLQDNVLVAELIGVNPDPEEQEVMIDKGSVDNVFVGQPVLDANGLMGQVVEVSRYSSRVLLISDVRHSVPVQVLRSNLRLIAQGMGLEQQLELLHVNSTADIRVGDQLLSSGLGNRFPIGYPVGTVEKVEFEPGRPFAEVRATPTAQLDRTRHVLLVFSESRNSARSDATAAEDRSNARDNNYIAHHPAGYGLVCAAAARLCTTRTRLRQARLGRHGPDLLDSGITSPGRPDHGMDRRPWHGRAAGDAAGTACAFVYCYCLCCGQSLPAVADVFGLAAGRCTAGDTRPQSLDQLLDRKSGRPERMDALVSAAGGLGCIAMALGILVAALFAAKVRRRMKLILGSSSPRRQMLLEQLGITFTIDAPAVDETPLAGEVPQDYVLRLAEEKANEVAARNPDAVVLSADTIVVHGGKLLGKPRSKAEGLAMLRALSNSTHDVVSGVAVAGIRAEQFFVSSRVRFRELSEAEMAWYWETGEPADKAGSYGLQGIGSAFVASIEGSYSNVIGLPLVETVAALRKSGIECLGVSGQ